MALDFPANPSPGDVYQNWTWDGEKWTTAAASGAFLPLIGGVVTGNLGVQGATTLATLTVQSGATFNGNLVAFGNAGFVGPASFSTILVNNTSVFRQAATFEDDVELDLSAPANPQSATPREWVEELVAAQTLYQGVWNAATNVPDLTNAALHRNGYTWTVVTPDHTQPFTVPLVPPITGVSGQTVYNGDKVTWSQPATTFQIVHGSSLSLAEAEDMFLPFEGGVLTGPGDLTVEGELEVDRVLPATVGGPVTIVADLEVDQDLGVTGDTELTGDLTVHGDTALEALTVNGDTRLNGSFDPGFLGLIGLPPVGGAIEITCDVPDLQDAIDSLPKFLNRDMLVTVNAGNWDDHPPVSGNPWDGILRVDNFSGPGELRIDGGTGAAVWKTRNIVAFSSRRCNPGRLNVYGITTTQEGGNAWTFSGTNVHMAYIFWCCATGVSPANGGYAFYANESTLIYMSSCLVENKHVAFWGRSGRLRSNGANGTNNNYIYYSSNNGFITLGSDGPIECNNPNNRFVATDSSFIFDASGRLWTSRGIHATINDIFINTAQAPIPNPQIWTTPGNYIWTVPKTGRYLMMIGSPGGSGVDIAAGAIGTAPAGWPMTAGGSGACGYLADIPLTQGETISVGVGSGGTVSAAGQWCSAGGLSRINPNTPAVGHTWDLAGKRHLWLSASSCGNYNSSYGGEPAMTIVNGNNPVGSEPGAIVTLTANAWHGPCTVKGGAGGPAGAPSTGGNGMAIVAYQGPI